MDGQANARPRNSDSDKGFENLCEKRPRNRNRRANNQRYKLPIRTGCIVGHPKLERQTATSKSYWKNQMGVSGVIITMDTLDCHLMKALVDSGCTGSCINEDFVKKHNLNTTKLPKSIPVFNADGSSNVAGRLTHMVQLQVIIGDHKEIMEFGISNLGTSNVFLGHDWLKHHNPEIDWKGKTIWFNRCPGSCYKEEIGTDPENDMRWLLEEGERLLAVHLGSKEMNVRTKMTYSMEIASAKKDTWTIEEILLKYCHPYQDVFGKQTFNELPPWHPWDHAIELVEGAKALDCKIYPLSKEEQTQLKEFLKENLETNWIRPSKSLMASPFFFVKKKDGKLRPIQDYWKLNEMMIKNRYPLLLISELIDKLTHAKIFSKMDIRWGYNNIRIKEGDKWKAAFRTNRGLFKPLVMFFGLTNSPATFQIMMNNIFRGEIAEGWVIIYMDDILVFSKNEKDHEKHVGRILQKLREHKLSLKPEKCWFSKREIEFLGLIISEDLITMDKGKVEAIRNWLEPKNKKELQQFLGFVNFYWWFVEGFAKIAKPLAKLTGKESWEWTKEQQNAFDGSKAKISKEITLIIPNDNGQFQIEVNASDFAMGGILSQHQKDDTWRPVAFISKSFNSAKWNYEIYDKEMLAIMYAFYKWSHYLKGVSILTEVLTNHQNLTYFRKPQNLNWWQAWWVMDLQDFNSS